MTLRAIQQRRGRCPLANDPSWLARFLASLAREDLSPATLRGYGTISATFCAGIRACRTGRSSLAGSPSTNLIAYRQQMVRWSPAGDNQSPPGSTAWTRPMGAY